METILIILAIIILARAFIMIPCFILIYFYIKWKKKEEKPDKARLVSDKDKNIVAQDDESDKGSFKEKIINFTEGLLWYSMSYTGRIPSHHIRNFLYKHVFLVNIGKKVVIYNNAEFRAPYKLKIGEGSIIGNRAILDARRGGITIGKNVNLSTGVWLWTGQHDHNDPYFRSVEGRRGPIEINDRVWIGPRVTILHSVTIGEGAVIAAGAVVTKNVEPFSIYAGIPAKKIGDRNNDLRYEFQGIHIPFY
jgi:acetyltransferase-like isoleucine patch superfamily enzyme